MPVVTSMCNSDGGVLNLGSNIKIEVGRLTVNTAFALAAGCRIGATKHDLRQAMIARGPYVDALFYDFASEDSVAGLYEELGNYV
ncbi:MAG TPA: hypothetical protein VGI46_12120 [Candidatus Acidoferrum sp.]